MAPNFIQVILVRPGSLSPMLVSTLKFVCESGSKGSDLLLILAAAASIGDKLPGRTCREIWV
jgi:hypothetical protein